MKIAITTLGCKVNQYESAGIIESLKEKGIEMVPFNQPADYYIINTCSVTSRSDMQSRQLIRRAARTNPKAQIIVTGCYAKLSGDELSRMPGVSLVTDQKALIPEIIAAAGPWNRPILPDNLISPPDLANLKPIKFQDHTRAFLKIQDGCNGGCSYCVIPLARGPSRSIPEKEVIHRIQELSHAGYREVVLTGIHLGAYGMDLNPSTSLFNIAKMVHNKQIVGRLRLSSIEPVEITDSLITLIRDSDIICHHLHIPLQSGDDHILHHMGRPYDTFFFKQLLYKIWQAIPDMAVGIDAIVGFPGEDNQAFQNTLQLIEDLPIAYLHVFPYSERPGTRAATMSGRVPDSEKKARAEWLRDLGKRKRAAYAEKFIGKTLSVLMEGRFDRKSGLRMGFSSHYIPVMVTNGNALQVNRIVPVLAEYFQDGKLIGRIVDD